MYFLNWLRIFFAKLIDILTFNQAWLLQHPFVEEPSKKFLKLCLKISQCYIQHLQNKERLEFGDNGYTASYVEGFLEVIESKLRQEMEKKPKIVVSLEAIKQGTEFLKAILIFTINNLYSSFSVFIKGILFLNKIEKNEDLNDLITDSLASGAVYLKTNQEGHVCYWHSSCVSVFGFTSDQVMGKLATLTFIPDKFQSVFKTLCTRPELYTINLNQNIGLNGENLWFLWLNFSNKDNTSKSPQIISLGWKVYSPRFVFTLIRAWENWRQIKSRFTSLSCFKEMNNPLKILQVKSELKKALSEKQFFLLFQPQLDPRTNKLIGVEALVRWEHPEYGMIPPDDFIISAEILGLIGGIDMLVLEMACLQIKEWHKTESNIKISVNLSSKNLENNKLVRQIAQILYKTDTSPELIELEITESWKIQDFKTTIQNLKDLKNIGIAISLDDFGSKNTSWQQLTDVKFNTLKVDRSYISDLGNHSKKTLLKKMIQIGQELGSRLVVEGVENSDQLDFLKEHNCDGCQGQYYDMPLSAYDFEKEYLKKYNVKKQFLEKEF